MSVDTLFSTKNGTALVFPTTSARYKRNSWDEDQYQKINIIEKASWISLFIIIIQCVFYHLIWIFGSNYEFGKRIMNWPQRLQARKAVVRNHFHRQRCRKGIWISGVSWASVSIAKRELNGPYFKTATLDNTPLRSEGALTTHIMKNVLFQNSSQKGAHVFRKCVSFPSLRT